MSSFLYLVSSPIDGIFLWLEYKQLSSSIITIIDKGLLQTVRSSSRGHGDSTYYVNFDMNLLGIDKVRVRTPRKDKYLHYKH